MPSQLTSKSGSPDRPSKSSTTFPVPPKAQYRRSALSATSYTKSSDVASHIGSRIPLSGASWSKRYIATILSRPPTTMCAPNSSRATAYTRSSRTSTSTSSTADAALPCPWRSWSTSPASAGDDDARAPGEPPSALAASSATRPEPPRAIGGSLVPSPPSSFFSERGVRILVTARSAAASSASRLTTNAGSSIS